MLEVVNAKQSDNPLENLRNHSENRLKQADNKKSTSEATESAVSKVSSDSDADNALKLLSQLYQQSQKLTEDIEVSYKTIASSLGSTVNLAKTK